jgi:hypothetical protein
MMMYYLQETRDDKTKTKQRQARIFNTGVHRRVWRDRYVTESSLVAAKLSASTKIVDSAV